MRITILDSVYRGVLDGLAIDGNPTSTAEAEANLKVVESAGQGLGSSYKTGFIKLGHNCTLIYANASSTVFLPKSIGIGRWLDQGFVWRYWQLISRLPIVGPFVYDHTPMVKHILTSIEQSRPDVLLVLNINLLTKRTQKLIHESGIKLVGQHASPLPPKSFFNFYNLIYSAHPGQVAKFRQKGIRSEYVPLALDALNLEKNPIPFQDRLNDLVFVGSFSRHYPGAAKFFRQLASSFPQLRIFSLTSPKKIRMLGLAHFLTGKLWGRSMLDLYSNSKVVLNRHIDMADGFSVNLRMFEATGSGAILLTEKSPNLDLLFEPDVEVLTYSTAQEAIKKIGWALSHPIEASVIARAGYNRTRSNHLSEHRIEQIQRLLMSVSVDPKNSIAPIEVRE